MDIDKIKQSQQQTLEKLAVTQIPNCVGQAVLRLLQQGQPLSVEGLAESMRQPVAHCRSKTGGARLLKLR
jgi:Tfp pilus assembly protein PilN